MDHGLEAIQSPRPHGSWETQRGIVLGCIVYWLYCCIAVLLYGATVGEGQGGMAVWPNTLLYLLYENLYSQKLYGPAAGL